MDRLRQALLFKYFVVTMVILMLIFAAFIWPLKQQLRQKHLARATADFIKANNDTEALRLLKEGVDPNYKDIYGNTLIMVAIYCKRFEIVQYLSAHGASLNIKNEAGATPLFGAVDVGDIQTVVYLINKGANVNSQKEDGTTPLMVAVFRRHIDIAKLSD